MTTAIIIGLLAALVVSHLVNHVATRLHYQCTCYKPRHSTSGEPTPVRELLPATSMDPAGPTRPDIRWQVTS